MILKDIWKQTMAKETKTTFEITATNRGNFKDFKELFRKSKLVTDLEIKILNTDTKDLGKISEGQKVADHLKIIRKLLKQACDNIGLVWDIPGTEQNKYHIRYGYGDTIFVYINEHRACCLLKDNNIWLYLNPRGFSSKQKPHKVLNLADPELLFKLEKIFSKINKGEYDV